MNSGRISLNERLIEENNNAHIKSEFLNSITDYPTVNKQYRNISRVLLEMGFELTMIEMIFCFFNVQSIEQGISLLTKEEGQWQHMYIESEGKVCMVCGEYCDHLNLNINPPRILRDSLSLINEKIRRSKETMKSKDSFISVGEENPFQSEEGIVIKVLNTNKKRKEEVVVENDCDVCFSALPENPYHLNCKHKFCDDCWKYYLEEKITTSQVKFFNKNKIVGKQTYMHDEGLPRNC
jgi:hypothetical protein